MPPPPPSGGRPSAELHGDPVGVGVAHRVAQGLLCDAVEVLCHPGIGHAHVPRGKELAGNGCRLLHPPGERTQRRRECVGLRLHGAQPERDVVSLVYGLGQQ